MLFTDEFLAGLKDRPVEGALEIIRITRESFDNHPEKWSPEEFEMLIDAYALISGLVESGLLPRITKPVHFSGSMQDDCRYVNDALLLIEGYCSQKSTQLKLDARKLHYRQALSGGFAYEFSQGDLDRVQQLVNELRDLIANSTHFEADHQSRLLKRLEKLQSELHKRVSDLDRFWGLIGDAGVVLGKFGKDAKPLVDRIREIADIIWRTQARAEELPSSSNFPSLENKPSDD
ncbi:MAG: hypothetical protein RLZZ271_1390 [Pseudomonadota bacterium]|jgi:hypothetical protein